MGEKLFPTSSSEQGNPRGQPYISRINALASNLHYGGVSKPIWKWRSEAKAVISPDSMALASNMLWFVALDPRLPRDLV